MFLALVALAILAGNSAKSAQTQPADNWTKLNSPTNPGGKLLDFAISASDPELLYAWFEGETGSRLFKSQDSALTWQQVFSGTFPAKTIAISRDNPQILYAGGKDDRKDTPTSFYKSSDAGLSWTEVYTLSQVSLVVSSTLVFSGGTLLQPETPGCQHYEAIIARSDDGGITWQKSSLGCNLMLLVMTVEPENPGYLYLGAMDVSNGRSIIWRSSNDGETWQHIDSIFSEPWLVAVGGGRIYAATPYESSSYRIYRSDDDGATWWQSLYILPDHPVVLNVSPGNPHFVFAGSKYYGIWRSETYGGNWTESNNGIATPASISGLVADPADPEHLLAVSSIGRGGLFESPDGGLSWTRLITDTRLSSVVIHPLESVGIFASGLDGLYQAQNSLVQKVFFYQDMTWQVTLSHHNPPWALVSCFANHYFIARYRPDVKYPFWTWSFSNFENGVALFSVTSDPFSPNTLFAGGFVNDKQSNIWKSTDGGDSWESLPPGVEGDLEYLQADRVRPGWLYTATQSGPFFSQNGGVSWVRHINGLPTVDVMLRTFTQDEWGNLYGISVYHGLYRWQPETVSWEFLGQPEKTVLSLAYRPDPSPVLLVGGEYHLWRYDLPQPQRYWFPIVAK